MNNYYIRDMKNLVYHNYIEAFYTGVEDYTGRKTGCGKPIILQLYSVVRGFFILMQSANLNLVSPSSQLGGRRKLRLHFLCLTSLNKFSRTCAYNPPNYISMATNVLFQRAHIGRGRLVFLCSNRAQPNLQSP